MKPCPYCAESIQDAAIVCKHCGRNLGQGSDAPRKVSLGAAAVYSLLIPGLGQLYKGEKGLGVACFLFIVAGYFVVGPFAILLHILCIVHAARP